MVLALLLLAGCGRGGHWTSPDVTPAAEGKAEAAYLAPPKVDAGARDARGQVVIDGTAMPGSKLRLVTPEGGARFATANGEGRWRLELPDAPQVRLFGLSMVMADRTVQSDGYLAVLPGGPLVRLRAGAGSTVLASGGERLRILAVDFDRDGGAMVSGLGRPGASLVLRIDGVSTEGQAGSDGRFSIAASKPLEPRAHQVLVGGDGESVVTLDASAAPPLVNTPMRASRTGAGWRIDWMTPGGGVQTTVIVES